MLVEGQQFFDSFVILMTMINWSSSCKFSFLEAIFTTNRCRQPS